MVDKLKKKEIDYLDDRTGMVHTDVEVGTTPTPAYVRPANLDRRVNGPFLDEEEPTHADQRREGDNVEFFFEQGQKEQEFRAAETQGDREAARVDVKSEAAYKSVQAARKTKAGRATVSNTEKPNTKELMPDAHKREAELTPRLNNSGMTAPKRFRPKLNTPVEEKLNVEPQEKVDPRTPAEVTADNVKANKRAEKRNKKRRSTTKKKNPAKKQTSAAKTVAAATKTVTAAKKTVSDDSKRKR